MKMIPDVPEDELKISFARSGGPGGQNVNKRETKAEARWNVDRSPVFEPEQKQRIKTVLANRITQEGELLVSASAQRSQDQNRAAAIKRLQTLVRSALTPRTKRLPTKPTRSSQRARLDEKTIRSRQKQERGRKNWDE